jgi:uncharacterized protein YdaU (DUF1376 family)
MDWYPHHIDPHRRNTRHLSTLEHGAYRLLMDEYMADRRPLPDDDRALAGIVKLPLPEWMIIAPTIRAFFRKPGDFLHLDRCDQELDAQDAKSKRATDKAKRAAEIRHRKNKTLDAMSMLGAEREQTAHPELPFPSSTPKEAAPFPDNELNDLDATSVLGDATRTMTGRSKSTDLWEEPLPETPPSSHTSSASVISATGEGKDECVAATTGAGLHPKYDEATQILKAIIASPHITSWGNVNVWLFRGHDLRNDIVPAVREVIIRERAKNPAWAAKRLEVFDVAIARARIRRVTPKTTKPQEHTDGVGCVVSSLDQFELFWATYPSRAPHPNPKKMACPEVRRDRQGRHLSRRHYRRCRAIREVR